MSMVHESVREMAARLSGSGQPAHVLNLAFDGLVVRVNSNSQELIDNLASYFNGFTVAQTDGADIEITALEEETPSIKETFTIKVPDPGKIKIKEEFLQLGHGRLVRKRLTGMMFLFGGGVNLAIGPCVKNDNQVVNFINNRLIQWELERGALLAHAAAVNHQGLGLALAGFSGMGKSTLALHLMSRGLNFISNDRLLIQETRARVTMRGVPKLPRINPGTALNNPDLISVIPEDEKEAFGQMSSDEIWTLEHKYDVDITKCFGPGRFRLMSPLNVFGILNWNRNEETTRIKRVDLAERRDLLGALCKSPGLFYLSGNGTGIIDEDKYLKRLKDVAVYEISGGVDFQNAASACLDILDSI